MSSVLTRMFISWLDWLPNQITTTCEGEAYMFLSQIQANTVFHSSKQIIQADESKEIKVITICKALSSVHKSGTCTQDFCATNCFSSFRHIFLNFVCLIHNKVNHFFNSLSEVQGKRNEICFHYKHRYRKRKPITLTLRSTCSASLEMDLLAANISPSTPAKRKRT
jgi:hypothetical protein